MSALPDQANPQDQSGTVLLGLCQVMGSVTRVVSGLRGSVTRVVRLGAVLQGLSGQGAVLQGLCQVKGTVL